MRKILDDILISKFFYSCDLVGFHIEDYCFNFIDCCQRGLGCRVDKIGLLGKEFFIRQCLALRQRIQWIILFTFSRTWRPNSPGSSPTHWNSLPNVWGNGQKCSDISEWKPEMYFRGWSVGLYQRIGKSNAVHWKIAWWISGTHWKSHLSPGIKYVHSF